MTGTRVVDVDQRGEVAGPIGIQVRMGHGVDAVGGVARQEAGERVDQRPCVERGRTVSAPR